MTRTYWQQAAGDGDRFYAAICLKWDVILNGPGYAGRWPNCEKQLIEDKRSSRKITDIKRFSEEISDGDVIVLRLATKQVLGVGLVIGNYDWLDIFADVDGWDIQHVRRVKWLWKGLEEPKRFPTYTLKQGDTTQLLDHKKSEKVLGWIKKLNLNFSEVPDLITLPPTENREVKFDDVSEFLFDYGVSSTSIEILSKEIDQLIRVAKWYENYPAPSESETRSYLVVPLLRALGWTPQKMAIEWNNSANCKVWKMRLCHPENSIGSVISRSGNSSS